MKKRLEAKVTGLVQGVMFRDFVQRKARARGITGWVRNERDGSVRIVAEGESGELFELTRLLKHGPVLTSMRSRVDNVEVSWQEVTGEFNDFEIRYA